ncbi:hypothetical protein CDAR_501951 [Caerostris darwini]|uniref:Uncharacterized protein n=1 Tax=Caerostris darwini TaxID=1538125 RepID=A0AAV4TLB9_9ARAC|nr:hypothetical protein CDAR_501951 [Caerostris darwini]
MQHVRNSVKVFSQQSNTSTGSKHADTDPQLEELNNQYSPVILGIGNESEPHNLDHHIATQETRKEIFGEIPQHLQNIASDKKFRTWQIFHSFKMEKKKNG